MYIPGRSRVGGELAAAGTEEAYLYLPTYIVRQDEILLGLR